MSPSPNSLTQWVIGNIYRKNNRGIVKICGLSIESGKGLSMVLVLWEGSRGGEGGLRGGEVKGLAGHLKSWLLGRSMVSDEQSRELRRTVVLPGPLCVL